MIQTRHPTPREETSPPPNAYTGVVTHGRDLVFGAALLALSACTHRATTPEPTGPSAAAKLRATIVAHGADRLADARVDFSFRGTPYRMTRVAGRFTYERWREVDGEPVHERLDNRGFRATRAGEALPLEPQAADARGRGLNSVVYFASLPYGLEDPAVRATDLGPSTLEGRPVDRIEVRFAAEGGGHDHDDVFVYWLDAQTHRLAALAYRFHTGKGGVRLRRVAGTVVAGGVTFTQWDNYGLDGADLPELTALPDLQAKGALPRLSSIVLEDVRIGPAR